MPSAEALTPPLVLLLGLCTSILGCGYGKKAEVTDARPPAVEAVQARTGTLPLVETLSGVVRARNQVSIRPEIASPIIEVMVQTGDDVVKGQPLVRLDRESLAEQGRQAEANLRLAEASAAEVQARVAEAMAQATRTRALHAEALVSDLDLETQDARLDVVQAQADQARARVDQVRATLAERRNATERAVIRAPIAGRVGQRNAEVGMLADPSSTLFLIGDFSELIVEIPLTEGVLGYVQPGQRVEVSSASWERSAKAGQKPLSAKISRISPFLSAGSFSTTGEIDVSDGEGLLQPGMFVNVNVFYGETETATLIPNSALWDDPASGEEGVWVVREMPALDPLPAGSDVPDTEFRVVLQPVTVLARGRAVTGVEGISEGSWVVTVGQQLLSEAQSIMPPGASEVATRGTESVLARVRPTAWERVVGLQSLQREDLLLGFLEKQRRLAKTLGASIPPTDRTLPDEAEPGEVDGTVGSTAAGGL